MFTRDFGYNQVLKWLQRGEQVLVVGIVASYNETLKTLLEFDAQCECPNLHYTTYAELGESEDVAGKFDAVWYLNFNEFMQVSKMLGYSDDEEKASELERELRAPVRNEKSAILMTA